MHHLPVSGPAAVKEGPVYPMLKGGIKGCIKRLEGEHGGKFTVFSSRHGAGIREYSTIARQRHILRYLLLTAVLSQKGANLAKSTSIAKNKTYRIWF